MLVRRVLIPYLPADSGRSDAKLYHQRYTENHSTTARQLLEENRRGLIQLSLQVSLPQLIHCIIVPEVYNRSLLSHISLPDYISRITR